MNLTVSNVSKSFKTPHKDELKVLKDVSLNLENGSVLRLKGPSGSGKTTFMNIVSGLILPDAGSIFADKTEITALGEGARDRFRAENIGYIFQTFNLLSPFSVIENVYAPLAFAGKLDSGYREKALEILKEVGLFGLEDRKPYHLSVGQRQRVSVARVLFANPSLILADEPTASLDAVSAKTVFDSILKCRKNGSTIIFASHDRIFDDFSSDLVFDFEKGSLS